ncbi:MAG: hypothetical protein IJ783_04545 [Kiritimatiellae bacterium]|nr:hypothetical protein [Kiritimatiellia bacterium]
MKTPARFAALPIAAILAASAGADTYYYWNSTTYGDPNVAANWGTASNGNTKKSAGWSAAAQAPDETCKLGCRENFYWDCGGGSFSAGNWGEGPSGAISKQYMYLKNGTFTVRGDGGGTTGWRMTPAEIHVQAGATLRQGDNGTLYLNSKAANVVSSIVVEDGGSFEMTGAVNPLNVSFEIQDGGAMRFAPSYWGLPGAACDSGIRFDNSGTLDMTSGMYIANGANSGGAITVSQNAGTLNLAGTLDGESKKSGGRTAVSLSFRFAGGTVNVTDDATFANCAAVTLAGPTTWNVASGKTVSFSGSVASFGFDSTAFGAGDTILTTADATLRAKVLADLAALGVSVEESGNDVRLAAAGPRTTPYTFYWVNNSAAAWADWNDAANWTDANGDAMAETPTAIDTVASFDATKVAMFADLGGVTNEIAALTVTHSSWWKYDQFGITNGTLVVGGTANFESPTPFDIWSGATLSVGNIAFSDKSTGENNMDRFVVHDGGRLEILGNFQPRQMNITVEDGGHYLYGANATLQNCNYGRFHNVYNSGTMDWPGGFHRQNNAWSVYPYVRQLAGEWILGDRLEMPNNIYSRVELTGGTLRATGDVSFRLYGSGASAANAWAKFMPQADITLEVAAGKTLDMARSDSRYVPFAYEPDVDGTNYAKITRTGAGTLLLADVPYSLDLQGGTTTFSANSRTAMGTLNVGAGQSFTFANANTALATLEDNAGTIAIAQPGLSIGALGAGAALSGTFAFDTTAFAEGDTIVTTPDATLRAAIKSAAETAFESAGAAILESGDTLTIGASAYIFDSTSVTDLNDPAGWQSGLPAAGRDVIVSGAGVNAIVTTDLTNVWNSITVQDGATLTIAAADLALPGLVLRGASALNVNADFEVASLSTILDGADVPSLAVASGATLRVPGGFGFKNVRLVLNGALVTTSDGTLTFGTASANETAYFAMTADGATVTTRNDAQATNGSRIRFLCPENGGAVAVDGTILVTNSVFAYSKYDGFAFGVNNPTNREATVAVFGTALTTGDEVAIAGAVRVVVGDGATLGKSTTDADRLNAQQNAFNVEVSQRGVLEIADGGALVWPMGGNGGDNGGWIRLRPDETGFVSFVLGDGATAIYQRAGDGNGKAAVSVGDATYGVACPYWWGRTPAAFRNCAAVILENGKTLAWTRADVSWGSNQNTGNSGNYSVGTTPFVGGGSLAFSNACASARSHEVTFNGGANTATGTLSVADDHTTLHFADGANWAGTVLWNADRMDLAVATTNTVSFGTLDLAGDFPIRVWKDGATLAHDTLNVGTYANNGGRLVPTMATDGAEFSTGDKFAVGTIAKTSPLPTATSTWVAVRQEIDGDAENDMLWLVRGGGTLITVW